MTSKAERARLWGALNRLRELAERDYGGGGMMVASVRWQVRFAFIFGGIGAALVVPELVVVRSTRDLVENLGTAVLAWCGLAVLGFGAYLARLSRRRIKRMRAYEERQKKREAARRALVELAPRCAGRTGSDVDLARAFLCEHWPAAAPLFLVTLPADIAEDSSEDRVTLVGEIDGRPLLVSMLDFSSKPREGARPPLMVVLVASPIVPSADSPETDGGPFRASARQLEETDAYRDLVSHGFAVRSSSAGIAAIREGIEHDVLDVDGVDRIAQSARELCRIAAAATDAPESPGSAPELDETSSRAVLEGFLGALRDGDAVGVLEVAHPRLFLDWSMEPSPEAVLAALRPAPRPQSWEPGVYVHASSGGSRTLDTLGEVDKGGANCMNLAIKINHTGGDSPANVCMLRLDERHWRVTGYCVGRKQLLGIEFPTTGD